MIKFKQFLFEEKKKKQKKKKKDSRKDRFTWDVSDIEFHGNRGDRFNWDKHDIVVSHQKLHEEVKGNYWSPHEEKEKYFQHYAPVKQSTTAYTTPYLKHPHYDDAIHTFYTHGKTLNDDQVTAILKYKNDSYAVNKQLRDPPSDPKQKKTVHYKYNKDHINKLDTITSNKIKQPITVWRGGTQDVMRLHQHMAPGSEFTDNGYISTSFDPDKAEAFSNFADGGDSSGKRLMFKINVPAGARGHHFDSSAHNAHRFNDEHEVVLHRGTRFRVNHHSSDDRYHYIHLDVVGNKEEGLT